LSNFVLFSEPVYTGTTDWFFIKKSEWRIREWRI